MARGTPHPIQTRAAALADLATGASLNATSRKFGVSRSSLVSWRDQAQLPPPAPQPTGVQLQKRDAIAGQLFEYLGESITTLAVQLRFFRTQAWLEKSSAAEAAILHGVIADKAIQLLAALHSDSADSDEPAG